MMFSILSLFLNIALRSEKFTTAYSPTNLSEAPSSASPDFVNLVQEYDALGASGLLGQIIKLIGDDYDICYEVVQDELNELLIENSFEMQAVRVANKINKIHFAFLFSGASIFLLLKNNIAAAIAILDAVNK